MTNLIWRMNDGRRSMYVSLSFNRGLPTCNLCRGTRHGGAAGFARALLRITAVVPAKIPQVLDADLLSLSFTPPRTTAMEEDFRSSDFVVSEYLNRLLESGRLPTAADTDTLNATSEHSKMITSTIMKLQYSMEEATRNLEDSMGQVLLAAPGLGREMLRIERESKALKDQMAEVMAQISTIETEDEDVVVDHLLRLDIVKNNMESAKGKISKSAGWNKNVREMEHAIEELELQVAAEKYLALKDSVALLEDLPKADERLKTLSRLQNRLQSALVPSVKGALNDESVERFQYFVKVHQLLGAETELIEMYSAHVASVLRVQWDVYDKRTRFSDWLQEFYESTLKSLHSEARRSAILFPKEVLPVLSRIIAGLFDPLTGAFNARIDHCFSVDLFVETFNLTMAFLSALELLVEVVSEKSKKGGYLRLSSLATMDTEVELALLTIAAPFEERFDRFDELVLMGLRARVHAVSATKERFSSFQTEWDVIQYLREVQNSIPNIVEVMHASVDMCVQLTGGTAAVSLSTAGDDALASFFANQNEARARIQELLKAGTEEMTSGEHEGYGGSSWNNAFWEVLEVSMRQFDCECQIYRRWSDAQPVMGQKMIGSLKPLMSKAADLTSRRMLGRRGSGSYNNRDGGSDETTVGKPAIRVAGRYLVQTDTNVAEMSTALAETRLRRNAGMQRHLSTYVTQLESDQERLFQGSLRALRFEIDKSLKTLYDVGLGPLKRYFEAFVAMDIWGGVSHDSVEEDENDEFGARKGALEYATGVGECLLSLVQRLEQFEDVRPIRHQVLKPSDLLAVAKDEWGPLLDELGWRDVDFSFGFDDDTPIPTEIAPKEGEEDDGFRDFADIWVTASALGAMNMYATGILRIRHISPNGAAQLVIDIQYIQNVLSALGVEVSRLMTPFLELLKLDESELSQLANAPEDSEDADRCTQDGLPLKKLVQRIAKQRGVLTTSF